MKEQLVELHKLLVESYIKLMKSGVEDPKLLKEIRELLKDNDITGNIEGMIERIDDLVMAGKLKREGNHSRA